MRNCQEKALAWIWEYLMAKWNAKLNTITIREIFNINQYEVTQKNNLLMISHATT